MSCRHEIEQYQLIDYPEFSEKLLLSPHDESSGISKPVLRPGLYVLSLKQPGTSERLIYVIFWPEETTWDDSAISTVKRNRVTFIRYVLVKERVGTNLSFHYSYLTQIADQIVVLISDNHCQNLVLSDSTDDDAMVLDEDETDRLFNYEVSKSNEQEENVTMMPGFKVCDAPM